MTTLSTLQTLSREPTRATSGAVCPFHDGVATLDLLLAELDPQNRELFDAVLDLRSLATARSDADACAAQYFRVRSLLAGSHYLAFYRVRCWANRALRVEARLHRSFAARVTPFPLDAARVDEVINGALAPLANEGEISSSAYARVTFATDPVR